MPVLPSWCVLPEITAAGSTWARLVAFLVCAGGDHGSRIHLGPSAGDPGPVVFRPLVGLPGPFCLPGVLIIR